MLRSFSTCLKINRSTRITLTPSSYFSSFAVHSADEHRSVVQQEPGVNFRLNWSLNAHGVTPFKHAYGNSSLKELASFGALETLTGTPCPIHAVGDQVSSEEFDVFSDEIQTHLSTLDTLYVEDGALGSYARLRCDLRIISDDPTVARLAKNLLVQLPALSSTTISEAGVQGWMRHSAIVVYLTSTMPGATSSPRLMQSIALGSHKFKDASIFVHGIPQPDVLMKALATVKAQLMAQSQEPKKVASMVLPCSLVESESGSLTLTFGSVDATTRGLKAAHYVIWSADGVSSLFGGAHLTTSSCALPAENIHAHPNKIVFTDGTVSTSLTTAQLVSKFSQELPTADTTAILETLLKEEAVVTALGMN